MPRRGLSASVEVGSPPSSSSLARRPAVPSAKARAPVSALGRGVYDGARVVYERRRLVVWSSHTSASQRSAGSAQPASGVSCTAQRCSARQRELEVRLTERPRSASREKSVRRSPSGSCSDESERGGRRRSDACTYRDGARWREVARGGARWREVAGGGGRWREMACLQRRERARRQAQPHEVVAVVRADAEQYAVPPGAPVDARAVGAAAQA